MSRKGRWPGTWSAICDRCGFKFPSDQLQRDWQGLMVDRKCFEYRHPQELIRGIPDTPATPWSRSEPPDQFVTVNYSTNLSCTPLGQTAVAGFAIAGCMIAGRPLESTQVTVIENI